MNVLVTGGGGFLGGYTVSELERLGHRVIGYDLFEPNPEMLTLGASLRNVRFGNVADLDALIELCRAEKIESIVHTAGRVGLEQSLADPVDFYRTNIMGMVNVCETARKTDVQKVILISSNAVYHSPTSDKLIETDPVFSLSQANPAAHYGTSKLAGEAIGMAYAGFQGVDFIALRVTAIYGFGMRQPMYIKPMVENAVLGKPTRFMTGGQMKRDYTHVLDCAQAVICALNAAPRAADSQRIFNVAAGRLSSAGEVANMVRRVIPAADIEITDTLTPLEEANVRMRAPLDIGAAKRVLGWAPVWSLEDGIRQYAQTFAAYVQSNS
jgi:nucleoside-diphosphate-sugar epimerase